MDIILFFVGAYLVGSIPSSYLIVKLLKGIDIREHGSGNPGATNVFRVAGAIPGIITFVMDLVKGLLPVLVANGHFGEDRLLLAIATGLCAMSGHMWTIFLGFKGGKGVATGTGVFAALLPVPTVCAFAVFSLVLLFTRYVSLGSISAALSLPLFSYFRGEQKILTFSAVLVAVLIIYKHRSNIMNLLAGKENKIGAKGA